MYWDKQSKNLGILKEEIKTIVTFEAKGDLRKIISLRSSCGCTTPIYDPETGMLKVSYKPGLVPKHLEAQGYYNSTKTITVAYEDGIKDVLSFNAKIIK